MLKYKNVEWSLPLLFYYNHAYGALRNLINNKNFKASVFGAPCCNWNGGRIPTDKHNYTEKELHELFTYINRNNGTVALTFNGVNLTKDDLQDPYCNLILKVAKQYRTKFIVFEESLKNYIKEKYPDAILVASVIKSIFEFQDPSKKKTIEEETNYYNELLENYDLVVVRPEYSKYYLLNNLKSISDISRIEILVNQSCPANCPKAIQDYLYINAIKNKDAKINFKCYREEISIDSLLQDNLFHSELLIKDLVVSGIKHIKLQGRSMNISAPEVLLHLLNFIEDSGITYNVIQQELIKEERSL